VQVRIVFADQRVIEVTATPGSDGLFVLPTVGDGPMIAWKSASRVVAIERLSEA
jgi:hypothetical protein